MSEHTGHTYVLRTVLDFAQVPAERRETCLDEFSMFLALNDAITDIASSHGVTPKDMGLLDQFTWIDDGKRDMTVSVQIKGEAR